VEFCGSSIYKITSSVNSDNLVSSTLIWMQLSFSCLKALARNYSTILNKNGKNRHLYCVPDFIRKVFSFCPFSMMFAMGFLD
jgi:hypothetical protein